MINFTVQGKFIIVSFYNASSKLCQLHLYINIPRNNTK